MITINLLLLKPQMMSFSFETILRKMLYKFLIGLNVEYDLTKIQILVREKKPDLEEVISIIQNEETRRNLMVQPQNMSVENSAFVIKHKDEKGFDTTTRIQCKKG